MAMLSSKSTPLAPSTKSPSPTLSTRESTAKRSPKLELLEVGRVLDEAIRGGHYGEGISPLVGLLGGMALRISNCDLPKAQALIKTFEHHLWRVTGRFSCGQQTEVARHSVAHLAELTLCARKRRANVDTLKLCHLEKGEASPMRNVR